VAAYSAWSNNGMSAPDNTIYEINSGCISKKACLCMAKIFRQDPNCVALNREMLDRTRQFIECSNPGVQTSFMPLLTVMCTIENALFAPVVPYVVSLLKSLVIENRCPHDYLYFRTACPWLIIKCIRVLALFKLPEESIAKKSLRSVVQAYG